MTVKVLAYRSKDELLSEVVPRIISIVIHPFNFSGGLFANPFYLAVPIEFLSRLGGWLTRIFSTVFFR